MELGSAMAATKGGVEGKREDGRRLRLRAKSEEGGEVMSDSYRRTE